LIAENVFYELRKSNASLSVSEFSRQYLGRSRSYLSNRRHHQKEISASVLMRLVQKLRQTASAWRQAADREKDPQLAQRWRQLSKEHLELADRVLADWLCDSGISS